MLIILKKDIKHVGRRGEVVKVKAGYFRNFLQYDERAVRATTQHLENLSRDKDRIAEQSAQEQTNARSLATQIEALPPILIYRNTSEDGKLYGSVTQRDIANALEEQGLTVPHKNVIINTPIKNVGEHIIEIYLHAEISTKLNINVLRKPK